MDVDFANRIVHIRELQVGIVVENANSRDGYYEGIKRFGHLVGLGANAQDELLLQVRFLGADSPVYIHPANLKLV